MGNQCFKPQPALNAHALTILSGTQSLYSATESSHLSHGQSCQSCEKNIFMDASDATAPALPETDTGNGCLKPKQWLVDQATSSFPRENTPHVVSRHPFGDVGSEKSVSLLQQSNPLPMLKPTKAQQSICGVNEADMLWVGPLSVPLESAAPSASKSCQSSHMRAIMSSTAQEAAGPFVNQSITPGIGPPSTTPIVLLEAFDNHSDSLLPLPSAHPLVHVWVDDVSRPQPAGRPQGAPLHRGESRPRPTSDMLVTEQAGRMCVAQEALTNSLCGHGGHGPADTLGDTLQVIWTHEVDAVLALDADMSSATATNNIIQILGTSGSVRAPMDLPQGFLAAQEPQAAAPLLASPDADNGAVWDSGQRPLRISDDRAASSPGRGGMVKSEDSLEFSLVLGGAIYRSRVGVAGSSAGVSASTGSRHKQVAHTGPLPSVARHVLPRVWSQRANQHHWDVHGDTGEADVAVVCVRVADEYGPGSTELPSFEFAGTHQGQQDNAHLAQPDHIQFELPVEEESNQAVRMSRMCASLLNTHLSVASAADVAGC